MVPCFLVMAFSEILGLFYLSRFVTGLCVGGLFTVMPNYISEIADKDNRGALSSMLNVYLTFGMLFSYAVGPYVSITIFNVILAVFPALFLVIFCFIGPETPQYYTRKNRFEEAKITLQKLRGPTMKVEDDIATIRKQMDEEGKGRFLNIFKSKGLLKAFVISVGLVAFQQFTGVCAVLFYAQDIFANAGSKLDPAVCSIIIGAVMFITSFLTPLLVDRLGRKILLLSSAVGMVLTEAALGIYCLLKDKHYDVSAVALLPVISLMAYIITYNFGFGPLPWTVMGELFPANIKASASSTTAGICWFLSFLVTKFFESVSKEIGMGSSFLIFAACCLCAALFTQFFVIETKGKTLEEIQSKLHS